MSLLIFFYLLWNTGFCQNQQQRNYNKEYNNILYLCQQSWYQLELNGASEITIFNSEGKVIKTHRFSSTKYNREAYMDKIIGSLYHLNDSITKIKIDSKVIDIKYNPLKSDYNTSMVSCVNQHAKFCKNQKNVTHNQGEKTYEERLDACDITGTGLISENCSKTYGMVSTRMDIRRIIRAYYLNKHKTLHWSSFMIKGFRFYTTSIVKGPIYTYSVTIFTQYKTDSI